MKLSNFVLCICKYAAGQSLIFCMKFDSKTTAKQLFQIEILKSLESSKIFQRKEKNILWKRHVSKAVLSTVKWRIFQICQSVKWAPHSYARVCIIIMFTSNVTALSHLLTNYIRCFINASKDVKRENFQNIHYYLLPQQTILSICCVNSCQSPEFFLR